MDFFRKIKSNIDTKIEVNVLYSWIDKGYGGDKEIEGLKETYIKDKYIQASQLQIDPKNTVAGILEILCDVYSNCGYWLFTKEMKDMDFIPTNITDMEDWEKRFRDKNKSPGTNKHISQMLIMLGYEEDILLHPVLFLY